MTREIEPIAIRESAIEDDDVPPAGECGFDRVARQADVDDVDAHMLHRCCVDVARVGIVLDEQDLVRHSLVALSGKGSMLGK